jgi:wobble nucleotide-excising tRNase
MEPRKKTNSYKRDSGTKEKKYISSDSSSSTESRKTNRNKRTSDRRTNVPLKRKNSLDYYSNFKKKKLGHFPRSNTLPYIIDKHGFISLSHHLDQPSLVFSPLSTTKRPNVPPKRYGVLLYSLGTIKN